jgi:hypothetical protein
LLDLLLSVEFPGSAVLREQAKVAMVTDEESLFDGFFLHVPDIVPRAEVVSSVPVEAYAKSPDGAEAFDVLLAVADGRLAEVNVLYAGESFKALPPLSAFEVFARHVDGELLGPYRN